jgi:hypothetical protein
MTNKAMFPIRREDGSVTVAARFSMYDPATRTVVEERVAEWVRQKHEDEHIDLTEDLASRPRVLPVGEESLEVVFEGKPGSTRWRDWMVLVTVVLTSELHGLVFDGILRLR